MQVKRVWKIDDSLDVFPVHGVGGILGTLMTGLFASTGISIFSGQGFLSSSITTVGQQLGVQLIGVLAAIAFTALMTWGLLKLVNVVTPLRVTQEEETEGLDIAGHDERGYVL
jgi:Amt family ammonium transporter